MIAGIANPPTIDVRPVKIKKIASRINPILLGNLIDTPYNKDEKKFLFNR
jgi:hypothetical protein